MHDVVNEVSGDQARMAIAQFMGMHMGELKEMDKSIISRNATLQGITLKPEDIIRSVPGVSQAPNVNVQSQILQPPPLNIQIQSTPAAAVPVVISEPALIQKVSDDPQLEFNFNYDIAKDIVDRLERVENLLKKLYALAEKDSASNPKSLKKT